MDDIEIEEDVSMENWIMDSFVDGQPNVQRREAETLERVRNMVGNQVTVESVDPSAPLDPNLAGHLRPLHTLRVNPLEGSSQAGLVFNSQPGVSSRGASSAPGRPPRNPSRAGSRGSPTGGQPPAGDPSPFFPRDIRERMRGQMDQMFERMSRRDEFSYGEQSGSAYPRWRSPLRGASVPY